MCLGCTEYIIKTAIQPVWPVYILHYDREPGLISEAITAVSTPAITCVCIYVGDGAGIVVKQCAMPLCFPIYVILEIWSTLRADGFLVLLIHYPACATTKFCATVLHYFN